MRAMLAATLLVLAACSQGTPDTDPESLVLPGIRIACDPALPDATCLRWVERLLRLPAPVRDRVREVTVVGADGWGRCSATARDDRGLVVTTTSIDCTS